MELKIKYIKIKWQECILYYNPKEQWFLHGLTFSKFHLEATDVPKFGNSSYKCNMESLSTQNPSIMPSIDCIFVPKKKSHFLWISFKPVSTMKVFYRVSNTFYILAKSTEKQCAHVDKTGTRHSHFALKCANNYM